MAAGGLKSRIGVRSEEQRSSKSHSKPGKIDLNAFDLLQHRSQALFPMGTLERVDGSSMRHALSIKISHANTCN